MNPFDRSVAELDDAMERRFDRIELNPNIDTLRNFLIAAGMENNLIGKVIEFFNFANDQSPHGFGHTYFRNINDEDGLIRLWNHRLKYFFEKMFHFQPEAYGGIKEKFSNIVTNPERIM